MAIRISGQIFAIPNHSHKHHVPSYNISWGESVCFVRFVSVMIELPNHHNEMELQMVGIGLSPVEIIKST